MKAVRPPLLALVSALLLCASCASAAPVDFGSVKLAERKTAVVTLTFTAAARLARISIRTLGIEHADFIAAGKATCIAGKFYAAHSSCTVRVAFHPLYLGLRRGAVVLADKSGAILATTYIHGNGIGPPAISFTEPQTTIDGLKQPNGIAVDDRGSLYIVTDSGAGGGMRESNLIQAIPLPSGSFSTLSLISAIYWERIVAVDGGGNIFLAGKGMDIVKETAHPHGVYSESSIGSAMGAQCGIAIDGAGNVFTSDCNFNKIYKENLTPSGAYLQSVISSGIHGPAGIAVDGQGSLYIASLGDRKIFKETPSASGYEESAIEGTFSAPQGIAIDADGNLYISDFAAATVYKEMPTPAGHVQTAIVTDTGANYVTVDGSGNLYVSDLTRGQVLRISLANPPQPQTPPLPPAQMPSPFSPR
jgi:sugar lactone lactonase YvrE